MQTLTVALQLLQIDFSEGKGSSKAPGHFDPNQGLVLAGLLTAGEAFGCPNAGKGLSAREGGNFLAAQVQLMQPQTDSDPHKS